MIGLEIHVQLSTRTKMFCGCELSFNDPPNTHTCPVCLGLPGALPVVNERAIHYGIMIGLALGCEIAERSLFHRKNYFYPDLPKGYQISQYDVPLCRGGRLDDVRIHRVHLEEDAAKLNHLGTSGRIHGADRSWVDFNRGGTPLVEIVTEPDLRSPEQAREWPALLRTTLRQLGVSDVNMEEGSLRVDANVSVRPAGSTELGTKTELKNMNSFRFLERGVKAEIARQIALLESGEAVEQETLHYDPASDTTHVAALQGGGARLPLLPRARPRAAGRDRRDAGRRARGHARGAARRARRAVRAGARPERRHGVAVRASGRISATTSSGRSRPRAATASRRRSSRSSCRTGSRSSPSGSARRRTPPTATSLPRASRRSATMVKAREVSRDAAREVLTRLVEEGGDPRAIVEREGLGALTAEDDGLGEIVDRAIAADPAAAEQVRSGNMKAIGPLVGFVMRETKGRADGGEITRLIRQRLGRRDEL